MSLTKLGVCEQLQRFQVSKIHIVAQQEDVHELGNVLLAIVACERRESNVTPADTNQQECTAARRPQQRTSHFLRVRELLPNVGLLLVDAALFTLLVLRNANVLDEVLRKRGVRASGKRHCAYTHAATRRSVAKTAAPMLLSRYTMQRANNQGDATQWTRRRKGTQATDVQALAKRGSSDDVMIAHVSRRPARARPVR